MLQRLWSSQEDKGCGFPWEMNGSQIIYNETICKKVCIHVTSATILLCKFLRLYDNWQGTVYEITLPHQGQKLKKKRIMQNHTIPPHLNGCSPNQMCDHLGHVWRCHNLAHKDLSYRLGKILSDAMPYLLLLSTVRKCTAQTTCVSLALAGPIWGCASTRKNYGRRTGWSCSLA